MAGPNLPTATYDKAKALKARRVIIVFTPTGVGAVAVNVLGKLADLKADTTIVDSKFPDAAGMARPVDHIATEGVESITLKDMEDFDTILSLLGGLSGIVKGTAQAFFLSPDDAAGKVRLLTDVFPCAVQRGGNISTEGFAKNPTLEFLSEKLGPITFTPNADVTVA